MGEFGAFLFYFFVCFINYTNFTPLPQPPISPALSGLKIEDMPTPDAGRRIKAEKELSSEEVTVGGGGIDAVYIAIYIAYIAVFTFPTIPLALLLYLFVL